MQKKATAKLASCPVDKKQKIGRQSRCEPTEALQIDNDNLADVQAHYEYLADDDAINENLDALKKWSGRVTTS